MLKVLNERAHCIDSESSWWTLDVLFMQQCINAYAEPIPIIR